MPRLRDFYPYTRGRVGQHEYMEYLEENAPSPEEYMDEPTTAPPFPYPPGGGAHIATPEHIEGGEILAAGGIDERIAQLKKETAAIRGGAPFEELTALQKGHQAEIEKLTPEQKAYYEKRLAARRRPPEGYRAPDFSDAGRERYEQGVFREIQNRFRIPGGNPFKINPTDAVDEAMAKQLPKLFEQVFGGRILFSDASRLEGKALKYWNAAVLAFKAEVFKKAEMALKRAEGYHQYAMSKYDTQRKRVEGKREQERKEAMKPPEMKLMVSDKDEQTWHEWDENTQKWVDTGKAKTPEKEEKPEKDEVKKAGMLDDWRSDYNTRLNQLKDDYGDFNTLTGLWMPNKETYKEYKKKRDKLINEYEKGMRSILEGKIPKRMAGALVGERQEEDYVGKMIKDLTAGY